MKSYKSGRDAIHGLADAVAKAQLEERGNYLMSFVQYESVYRIILFWESSEGWHYRRLNPVSYGALVETPPVADWIGPVSKVEFDLLLAINLNSEGKAVEILAQRYDQFGVSIRPLETMKKYIGDPI